MADIASFSDAVWAGDLEAVEAALREGVDVNASDGDRWPPLLLAIEQIEIEIARLLIEAGADVNADQGKGWTPLAHAVDIESDSACQAGLSTDQVSTTLTELLLASGARPTDEAIELAKGYGNWKVLALLTSS